MWVEHHSSLRPVQFSTQQWWTPRGLWITFKKHSRGMLRSTLKHFWSTLEHSVPCWTSKWNPRKRGLPSSMVESSGWWINRNHQRKSRCKVGAQRFIHWTIDRRETMQWYRTIRSSAAQKKISLLFKMVTVHAQLHIDFQLHLAQNLWNAIELPWIAIMAAARCFSIALDCTGLHCAFFSIAPACT